MSRWYRAYAGTTSDAKLGEAALIAGCSRAVAIAAWHAILEAAAEANAGGSYETTPRRVAVILGEPVASLDAVFAAFTEIGLVADGQIVAWRRRQYESDNSTERSRAFRERRKTAAKAGGNADATPMQRCATPPETETETEKKIDTGAERPPAAKPPAAVPIGEAVEAYNAAARECGWPVAKPDVSPKRKSSIRARLADGGGIEAWKAAMARAARSPFLRGDTGRGAGHEGWRPTIDFFLRPDTFAKLTEGAYDPPGAKAGPPAAGGVSRDPRAPESDFKAEARLRAHDEGRWHEQFWGPPPGSPGCLIPSHVIDAWNLKRAA